MQEFNSNIGYDVSVVNDYKFKLVVTLSGVIGFFLALAPILDPYVFMEIGSSVTVKINDVLMIFLGIICFGIYYHKSNEVKTNFLCGLVIGLTIITLLANIGNGTSIGNSLKNVMVWFVYACVLSFIWKTPCREQFFHWIEILATIATIIIFLQFIAGYLGIPMWDGRIPFLELGKYDQWSGYIDKNTGDIRPNGIFQEASYVGIYLSVAYTQTLKEGKIKNAIVYAIAMLLTTSMISVVFLIFITVYMLIAQNSLNISRRNKKKIVFIIVSATILLIVLISNSVYVRESFEYIVNRFNNFNSDLTGSRMSSTQYRLIGHLNLFEEYTFIQKLFGMGVSQYAAYFDVQAYSNVWVTILLNSGIIGIILFICILITFFRSTRKENKVFFWIFILLIISDYQWFSWYFFYLISASILVNDSFKHKCI